MTTPPGNTTARCVPKGRSLALPILGDGAGAAHPKIKNSRVGKWRAAVLILVHVAIAIHILHWWIAGSTVTPVEPSESMQTLRDGVLNAGFIFFTLAILSTLIFGRWFCGWGCHIVALQDTCTWLMSRVGVKPKPFRSRLLLWVPLIVAVYMFVWPVVHRDVLRPLFMDDYGNLPLWLGQNEPLDALRSELLTRDFWATFAPWYIAIPFIFICTFGAVYFLGSKGFCTYGCPYGGFFAPVDRAAPGRIRVTDACEGCGHCTAVCTSNVRVHEEVRDFGMVVDPGCMKCMDCVSVCPKEALYFGFGRPALRAKPRTPSRLTEDEARAARAKAKADRAARYDLSLWEEWTVGLLFLAFFLCFRGMANSVPMLMALGMAGIASFCTWKLWSLFTRPNVRLQSLQLKAKGRLRPAGVVLAALTIAAMAVAAWSGYVRYHLWRADAIYAHLDIPQPIILRADFEPSDAERATARAAIEHFRRASPPDDDNGGVGWPLLPDQKLTLAYLHSVLGEFDQVEKLLLDVIRTGRPLDPLVTQVAQLIQRRAGESGGAAAEQEILNLYSEALALHPGLDGIRAELAGWHLRNNRRDEADKLWNDAVGAPGAPSHKAHPTPSTLLAAARYHAAAGNRARAIELIDAALADKHAREDIHLAAAGQLAQLGERARAIELARSATEFPTRRGSALVAAAGLLVQLEDAAAAADFADRAVDRARDLGPHLARNATFVRAAILNFQLGRPDQAKALLKEAADLAGPSPWVLTEIAAILAGYAGQVNDAGAATAAAELLARARDIRPDSSIIRVDLASTLFLVSRTSEAEAELKSAVSLSRTNPHIPALYAEFLRTTGRADEAAKWEAEAARRAAAAKPSLP